MQISLSEEDRARIGCDEWLEADPNRLSMEDAEALEVAGGDWTAYGSEKIVGVRALVWVALRRAGLEVDYATLRFDLRATRTRPSPGKAPSAPDASTTPSTSAPSGRRSPRKRSPSST